MEELKLSTLQTTELKRIVDEKKTELKKLQIELKKRGSRPLSEDARRSFRVKFREARAQAIGDAENFHAILQNLERLGNTLLPTGLSLNDYKYEIVELAKESPLAFEIPKNFRYLHTSFDTLYDIVKDARNDALHQGAYARHLTIHAIELSLILEDAMSKGLKLVTDYMVKNIICAELWQPISHIRQVMLANNFSFMPFQNVFKEWCFISDNLLANMLINESKTKRTEILSFTLEEAIHKFPNNFDKIKTKPIDSSRTLDSLLNKFEKAPLLICEGEKIIGIITAFDIM
jgi:predicted transcriptional regulator